MRTFPSKLAKTVPVVLLCGTLAGCYSSGLSAREGGSGMQGNYLVALTSDMTPARGARPRFAAPAVLAVAQIGEVTPPQSMLDELRKNGDVFARVHGIPATGLGGDNYRYTYSYREDDRVSDATRARDAINGLQNVARGTGADYLLLVGGSVDQNGRSTPLSVLDLTIIGAFVVPSHRTDALMKASGAVIDLRSGQLVTLSSAELKRKRISTLATAEGESVEMLVAMRDQITADLAKNVAADVRAIR